MLTDTDFLSLDRLQLWVFGVMALLDEEVGEKGFRAIDLLEKEERNWKNRRISLRLWRLLRRTVPELARGIHEPPEKTFLYEKCIPRFLVLEYLDVKETSTRFGKETRRFTLSKDGRAIAKELGITIFDDGLPHKRLDIIGERLRSIRSNYDSVELSPKRRLNVLEKKTDLLKELLKHTEKLIQEKVWQLNQIKRSK